MKASSNLIWIVASIIIGILILLIALMASGHGKSTILSVFDIVK